MTAQELIKELTRIIEEHGDLDVYCDGELGDEPVLEVEIEEAVEGDDWHGDLPMRILLI